MNEPEPTPAMDERQEIDAPAMRRAVRELIAGELAARVAARKRDVLAEMRRLREEEETPLPGAE